MRNYLSVFTFQTGNLFKSIADFLHPHWQNAETRSTSVQTAAATVQTQPQNGKGRIQYT